MVVAHWHVIALDPLTAGEAAELGPLLRSLTTAMRAVPGCGKTYVALFAEAAARSCRRAAGAVTSNLACGRLALSSRAALADAPPPGWSP